MPWYTIASGWYAGGVRKRAVSENKLNEQHIADSASRNRKQHLALPQMQKDNHCNRDQFGEAMAAGEDVYVLQAVYYQKAENRRRKRAAQVLNIFWRRFASRKGEKGKKPGEHCA